jgi:hypothetical protein
MTTDQIKEFSNTDEKKKISTKQTHIYSPRGGPKVRSLKKKEKEKEKEVTVTRKMMMMMKMMARKKEERMPVL